MFVCLFKCVLVEFKKIIETRQINELQHFAHWSYSVPGHRVAGHKALWKGLYMRTE